jgi:hypothetical protein
MARKQLFGVSLSEEGMDEKSCVFLETCIEYLENAGNNVQGLFRVCGCKAEIEELKEKADSDIFQFNIEGKDPHCITGLLKLFFRDLPEPLLSFDLYRSFLESVNHEQEILRKEAIGNCISLLQPLNVYLLGKLCLYLHDVSLHKEENLMNSENLSTCIGQNLIRSKEEDPFILVNDSAKIVSLCHYLINNATVLFLDIEKLRPKVTKESIRKINQQRFTIFLPPKDKKCIIMNDPSLPLIRVLQKLCLVRNIKLEDYSIFDNSGELVGLEQPLGEIKGRCIHLLPTETDKSTVTPSESDTDIHNSLQSSNEVCLSVTKNHRSSSLSIPKPVPAIPKLSFTPRSLDKSASVYSPHSAPTSANGLRSHHRYSAILSPKSFTSDSESNTPRQSRNWRKSTRHELSHSNHEMESKRKEETYQYVVFETEGPPPPVYVPGPPTDDLPIIVLKESKTERLRSPRISFNKQKSSDNSSSKKMFLKTSDPGKILFKGNGSKENQQPEHLPNSS